MGVTQKQLSNLKPAKKGEVRNPNGRPKKLPELDELLADVLGPDNTGKDKAKAILEALYKRAIKGDVRASELLLDRAYGKAKQSLDINAKVSGYKIGFDDNPET